MNGTSPMCSSCRGSGVFCDLTDIRSGGVAPAAGFSYCSCVAGVALQRNHRTEESLSSLWGSEVLERVDQFDIGQMIERTTTHIRSICMCPVCVALRADRIPRTPDDQANDPLIVPINITGAVTLQPRVRETMTLGAKYLFRYEREGFATPDFTDGIFVTKESNAPRAHLVVHEESNGCSVGASVNAQDLRSIAGGLLRAADLLDGSTDEPDSTRRSAWDRLKKPEF